MPRRFGRWFRAPTVRHLAPRATAPFSGRAPSPGLPPSRRISTLQTVVADLADLALRFAHGPGTRRRHGHGRDAAGSVAVSDSTATTLIQHAGIDMFNVMRTTLNIDDDVLQAAKHEAVERKVSLGELVSWALRTALNARRDSSGGESFQMVVHRPQFPSVSHEPRDFRGVAEAEDESVLRR